MKRKINKWSYVQEGLRGGRPCFIGTLISTDLILEHLVKGWSVAEIKQLFPSIKPNYIDMYLAGTYKIMSQSLLV